MNKFIIIFWLLLILESISVFGVGTDDLRGYWELDDNGTANDWMNISNLTLQNTPTFTNNGKINGAYNMTNSAWLEHADNSQLSITGDMTITVWIRHDSIDSIDTIIDKYSIPTSNRAYKFDTSSTGVLQFVLSSTAASFNGCILNSSIVMTADGSFHFVVARYKSGGSPYAEIWVDNVNVTGVCTTGSVPASIADSNAEFGIGANGGGGNSFNGIIDEVGIFNKTLSTTEMSDLYNSGTGVQPPFPAAALTFSNWNMTSDGGNDAWATNVNTSVLTSDSTPTITVTTSQSTHCRIGKTDSNWTTLGGTRNFTTTGSTSQIGTVIAGDALSIGNQFLYVACNFSEGATADVRLNITYQPSPGITVHSVTNNSVDQSLTVTLNVTATSDTESYLNITYYDASDNSAICTNTNISNGTADTCSWSGLKSNSSYTWNVTAFDGFSTAIATLYNFNTSENLLEGYTKDADGNMVGGSTVYIMNTTGDSLLATVTSNATGYYSKLLDYAGTYLVSGMNKSNNSYEPAGQLVVVS